jgi:hypothetical protein
MSQRNFALALVLAGGLAATAVQAQAPGSANEVPTKPRLNLPDQSDLWVLQFRFNPPRLVTVDIPGRGRKLCWYLLYRVSNPDPKQPHRFVPKFELVTLDTNPNKVSTDQVLPSVQKAIQQIEDPTGHLDIQNSVTIEDQLLPPSKPDANPRWVTGVAIWDDVNPETNQFNIFVSGLSNGYSVDDKDMIRRKTLQLNFQRLGDRSNKDARDIKFIAPDAWVYRVTSMKVAEAPKAPPAKPGTTTPPAPAPKPAPPRNPTPTEK